MVTPPDPSPPKRSGHIVISVDAMGGDQGPAAVVAGLSTSIQKNPDIAFVLHGPKDEL
ncbi:MAG: phosphate acyltransferase, partial [Pseudomonadota bacterium]